MEQSHDLARDRIFGGSQHEGFVDLELIGLQPHQQAQGGETGAEVVQGELHPGVAQALKILREFGARLHHGRFRDLQCHLLGSDALFAEIGQELGAEASLGQLAGTDVQRARGSFG